MAALVRRDARSVVVDPTSHPPCRRRRRHVDAATGELDALASRLPSTCWTRSGSASTVAGVPAGRTDTASPAASASGGTPARRRRPPVRSWATGCRANARPSRRASVEEVGDQAVEPLGLGGDDGGGAGRVGGGAVADRLGVATDRRQRRAQVVARSTAGTAGRGCAPAPGSAAIALTERDSSSSSSPVPSARAGRRVARSPSAMRWAAALASRTGRARRRPSPTATPAAEHERDGGGDEEPRRGRSRGRRWRWP